MIMEHIIENTNIFDYELKNKISSSISDELSSLDMEFTYRIELSVIPRQIQMPNLCI